MHPDDDTESRGATTGASERPSYGTRADYLEINAGTDTPAAGDPQNTTTEGGPELLDRLHDVYDPTAVRRDERDADA